jgi:alkyl hydroperoxide reductase subunit AhpC
MDGCATKVIEAADKYNLPDLKTEAEEVYADSCHLTVDNLLYHILYADTRDCGALKDNIIDFIIDHEEEVSEKVSVIVEEESRTLVWNW